MAEAIVGVEGISREYGERVETRALRLTRPPRCERVMEPMHTGRTRLACRISLLVTGCLFLASCECEKGPCRAAQKEQRASGIKQGVVGVVAYETDACESSCCECSWSRAELTVWNGSEPFTDRHAVIARVAQGAPTERFTADRNYEHALEPGDYLLCETLSCAALSIERAKVFTVNFQQVFGPTSLVVFESGKSRPDLVFEAEQALSENADASVEP